MVRGRDKEGEEEGNQVSGRQREDTGRVEQEGRPEEEGEEEVGEEGGEEVREEVREEVHVCIYTS